MPEDDVRNEARAEHVELLMQARTIHWHQAARTGEAPPPRQLPSVSVYFTDREETLAELGRARELAARAGEPLVVVCTGPGGVGKSELAARWLRDVADDISGAQLYADAADGGVRSAADMLGDFLRALGEERVPASTDQLRGRFRTLTHERPAVVFVDNVRLASQVLPLVPNSPGSVLIATARTLPAGLNTIHVPLGPLPEEAAVRLVELVAGRARADAAEVAALCGGLPLLLHSAARGRTVAGQAAAGKGLPGGGDGDGSGVEEDVLFGAAYSRLSAGAARVYRGLAALLSHEFDGGAAGAAAGVDEAGRALAELAAAGLVRERANGRYWIHDLVLAHSRRTAGDEERSAASRRLLGWYLDGAVRADHALMPGRWRLGPEYAPYLGTAPSMERAAARGWLETERSALRAAVHVAADQGWADLAVRLVEAQWALCFLLKPYEHWIEVHERAAEVAPAAGDARFEGRVFAQLGFGYLEVGRLDDAERAFAAARRADMAAGHVRGEATAVESLGLLMLRRSGAEDAPALAAADAGSAERALELLTDNLRLNLSMEHDDDRAVALAWRHLGRAHAATGRADDAVRELRRAIGLFGALPDPYNAAKSRVDLARTLIAAGSLAPAAAALAESLEPLRDAPADFAVACELLAALAGRREDKAGARAWLALAQETLDRLGSPRAEAVRRWAESLADL